MTATKIQPGDDTHLTLLMAPHSLNFVTGAGRAALLAYGRDVFAAGRDSKCLAQIEEPAQPVCWIRFCSDGSTEGPIMHSQICEARKTSGAWTPLYAGAAPAAAAGSSDERAAVLDAARDLIELRDEYAQKTQNAMPGNEYWSERFDAKYQALAAALAAAPALEAPAAPTVHAALQRLEDACDARAALTTSEAYNMLILLPGMQDALQELDEARGQACAALAAAPQAPAAPAVPADAAGKAHDWRDNASYGGETCAECGATKGSRRGNAPCTWPPAKTAKRWPFLESPGEFTGRLEAAIRSFGGLLPAVRNVLIEHPPTLVAAPAAPAVDAQDAARWRAFIASDRIRFFGWAGADSEGRKKEKNVYDEPNGNYVHFGAEFWSVHPARTENPEVSARLLTTYADACIAAQAAAKGEHDAAD